MLGAERSRSAHARRSTGGARRLHTPTPAGAALLQQICEVDPLACPTCHALTPEGEAKLDQRQANGVDNIEDVARFSNAIDLSDRGDYANAAIKMVPLVSKYPNSEIGKLHRRRDLPAGHHRQQAEGETDC